MKKSFLLAKILRRQNYLKIRDPENLSLPVDNVLMSIALRSGLLVILDDSIRHKLIKRDALSDSEVSELRNATKKVFEIVCREFSLYPDILDDILWSYGREVKNLQVDVSEIRNLKTSLDERIKNKKALREFLLFVTGMDIKEKSRFYRPLFPETWYF
ncbi:MAG TPA: hypothetical protein EYP30_05195 [Archaeoglobaceae archaeon]|nr:hypothetical protein [Archaeoglobaceae archaeon]